MVTITDGNPLVVDVTEEVKSDAQPASTTSPETSDKKVEKPSEKTYTEKELEILLAGSQGKKDKVIAQLTKELESARAEVENFKKQTQSIQSEHEETKERIQELEKDLETAIGNNSDMAEIQKIKLKLRTELAKFAQEKKELEDTMAAKNKLLDTERESVAKKAVEIELCEYEVALYEVAEDHASGETEEQKMARAATLKNLCEKTDKKTRQEIQELADILWGKKQSEVKNNPPVHVDSGITHGVIGKLTSEQIDKMSAEEYADHPSVKARYK